MTEHTDDPALHCRWCEELARTGHDAGAEAPEPPCNHRWEFEPEDHEIEYECVETLRGFSVGDCVRLARFPAGMLEELSPEERLDFESLVGDRFEIAAMMRPNIVNLARHCPGPNGEPGWETFTMPLELLEHAEWDPEPEGE